jgi:MYXO-CTERM domain-containing protein
VIEDDGCGCASGTRPTPVVALFLVALVLAGRRSRSMARRKPSRTPRANTLK